MVESKEEVRLEYAAPVKEKGAHGWAVVRWVPIALVAGGIVLAMVAVGTGHGAGDDLMSEVAMGMVGVGGIWFLGMVYGLAFRKIRKTWKGSTEAAEEEAWEKRSERRREAEEIAEEVYAKGPVGKWRVARVEQKTRTRQQVWEERVIEFGAEGKGKSGWFRRGHVPEVVEVVFEYRWESAGWIEVRVVNGPEEHGWRRVHFEFKSGVVEEEVEVKVVLKSVNPYSAGFVEHWPFWGEYWRVGE